MRSHMMQGSKCHPIAYTIVKENVIPSLKDNYYSRAIKMDYLAIYFANYITLKYPHFRNHKILRNRLLLLGRLKLILTRAHGLVELLDMFHPQMAKKVIDAILAVAGLDKKGQLKCPTAARMLGGLVRLMGKLAQTIMVQRHDPEKEMLAERFVKVFEVISPPSVYRLALKTMPFIRNRRMRKLLVAADGAKLQRYLCRKIIQKFLLLCNDFEINDWYEFSGSLLMLMQVFSRKKLGVLERLTITDYILRQDVEDNRHIIDLLESSEKYVQISIIGKFNDSIPLLLPKYLVPLINMVIKLRKKAGVSNNNPYVFGLPSFKSNLYHQDTGWLLQKYISECRARYPRMLKETVQYRYSATRTAFLYMNEGQLALLEDFMSKQAISTHQEEQASNSKPGIGPEINNILKSVESNKAPPDLYKPSTSSGIEKMNTVASPTKRKIREAPMKWTVKRRWTDEERKKADALYNEMKVTGSFPSLQKCREFIQSNNCLNQRTAAQLKSYLSNKKKVDK